MAADFNEELAARLRDITAQGLARKLRAIDSPQTPLVQMPGECAAGTDCLNFSSNDYLGLANHPALREAAIKAIERFGVGSGASRLVSGSLRPHLELEEELARFKDCPAALSFTSGYATAVGTISALVGADDVVVIDKLVHASIVDGAKLSGARLRVFKHNDLNDLERILRWADERNRAEGRGRTLIVTESVFSMDGDLAPLRNIVELKEQFGAWLMVDEAHAVGMFGEQRRGVIDAHELNGRVEIQMGTLGKALGASGGYICGSRELVDYLLHRARSFVFSTAPVPAAAAAATAALRLVQSSEGEQRRNRLWALVDHAAKALIGGPWTMQPVQSPIIPLIIGKEQAALALAGAVLNAGIYLPAIRYPTVARGAARLRVSISAAHTAEQIDRLNQTLRAASEHADAAKQPHAPAGET